MAMHLKFLIILFLMYLMIIDIRQVSAQTNDYNSSLNNYSFDLYREMKVENENLFLSPLSTYHSLLMVYDGSKNKTKREFEKVLHIKGSRSFRNSFSNDFGYNSDSSFVFNVSNAIWLDQNLQIKAGFKKRVINKYSSDIKQTEFANTLSAISDINGWVSEKTNRKINEIVSTDNINSDTKLLILNATYFKGEWLNKFEKTKAGRFYTNAENQCKVDFMRKTEQLLYYENEEYQFISKPYKASDMSFCIILPKKLFGIDDIEKNMNNDFFDKILDSTYRTKTSLSIPKFKLESSYVLNEALKNAGLKSAFSCQADFSGIIKKDPLMLGQVIHKTWIEIDEDKTEAAAATAVTVMITGGKLASYKVFTADHPFVFFIIDNRTRAIIFMGRYVEPINGEKILGDKESLIYNLEDRKEKATTVGSNNRILIVANEKIITQAELEAINPENIESLKILKDKEQISKYTSGNYDGVIVITLIKKRKNKKTVKLREEK